MSANSALDSQAWKAYLDGRYSDAIREYERLLSQSKPPAEFRRIEATFWLGCSLHSRGDLARAAEILDPICFDDAALDAEPLDVFRAITRGILIAIDLGTSVEKVERLIARADAALQRHPELPIERLRFARAHFEAARGRFGEALRLASKPLGKGNRGVLGFAFSAVVRLALTCLLRARRNSEVRELLDRWRKCGDPESFTTPHLELVEAAWHAERGDQDLALAWAIHGFSQSERSENLTGVFGAAAALVRAGLAAGRIDLVRTGLKKLVATRRKTVGHHRHEVELACADAYLGLAALHAGAAAPDPKIAVAGLDDPDARAATTGRDPAAVVAMLQGAQRSLDGARPHAAQLDALFGSRFRQSAIRLRERQLAQSYERFALAAASANAPETEMTPGVGPEEGSSVDREAFSLDGPPVNRTSDGLSTRLVLPLARLPQILDELRNKAKIVVQASSLEADGSMRVDVFARRHWADSAWAVLDDARPPSRVVVRTDQPAAPSWLEDIERVARTIEARHHADRAKRALEVSALEEALAEWSTATDLLPRQIQYWRRSADMCALLGRHSEARSHCLRALEIDSNDPATWETLACILEAEGASAADVKKARRIRDRWEQLQKEEPRLSSLRQTRNEPF